LPYFSPFLVLALTIPQTVSHIQPLYEELSFQTQLKMEVVGDLHNFRVIIEFSAILTHGMTHGLGGEGK